MVLIFVILAGWITVNSFLPFLLVLRIWWLKVFIYVFIYLFVCILFLHACLCTTFVCLMPVETRRGHQIFRYWIDSAELPRGCWELKLGYLEEQLTLLTAESLHQPCFGIIGIMDSFPVLLCFQAVKFTDSGGGMSSHSVYSVAFLEKLTFRFSCCVCKTISTVNVPLDIPSLMIYPGPTHTSTV